MKLNLVEPKFETSNQIGNFPILPNDALKQLTPSLFSSKTKNSIYDFEEVLEVIEEKGWSPVYAWEKPADNFSDYGSQSLFLKFRNPQITLSSKEDLFPELLLKVNPNQKHTQLNSGYLFRQTCSNGLVRGTEKRKHDIYCEKSFNNYLKDFLQGFDIQSNDFNNLIKPISKMKEMELNSKQMVDFSLKAIDLAKLKKISPEEVLISRRPEDEGLVLWNIFNRVQENVSKKLNKGLNIEFNENLWNLAERYTMN